MTSRNRRQRPQDRCVGVIPLCFCGRPTDLDRLNSEAVGSRRPIYRNYASLAHTYRYHSELGYATLLVRDAAAAAFGPKWRKQLARSKCGRCGA